MGDIVLSPAMFTAVNTLANIRTQMEAAQTRLATGNRVNSPLDDPNAWFTAHSLTRIIQTKLYFYQAGSTNSKR